MPTRVTNHSATVIDNIYSNASDLSITWRSGILRFSISDHYAIFSISNTIKMTVDKQTITKTNFSQKAISRFTKCVRGQTWISLDSLDTQNAFSWFQRVIDLHFEEHFPKQTITMSYKNCLSWLTEELRTQIKDKNSMHIQVMRNPDDQQLNLKYKTLRNEFTLALRNSELNHYSNELELNKSDLHKTWGVLRVIIGKDANNLKPKLQFQVMINMLLIAWKLLIVLMSSLSRLDLNLQIIF